MEIRIIPCRDTALLARLNAGVQDWHHRMYPRVFKPYNQEAISAYLEDLFQLPGTRAWLAQNGEEPCGYLILQLKESPENAYKLASREVYIDQVAVLETYQGQGIAKMLVETVKAFAKAEKADSICLDHWAANGQAAAVFKRLGFVNSRYRMELPF